MIDFDEIEENEEEAGGNEVAIAAAKAWEEEKREVERQAEEKRLAEQEAEEARRKELAAAREAAEKLEKKQKKEAPDAGFWPGSPPTRYKVMPKIVYAREKPDRTARMVGGLKQGTVISGYASEGWVRLGTDSKKLTADVSPEAYVLIDGADLGLGLLLEETMEAATEPPPEKKQGNVEAAAKPSAKRLAQGGVDSSVFNPPARETEDPRMRQGIAARALGTEQSADVTRSAEAIMAVVGEPYRVLGLQTGANSASVRRAYHRLALIHHPDKAGDEKVFGAISDAYQVLTSAKDIEGGWRDLEGKAVGPWKGHDDPGVNGVNVVCFDCFGAPPWESRRLYTAAWQEATVKCWELSEGEPGKVKEPPRLIGEIAVGGFINAVAALSPHGLLTAQSAGMVPNPGESLRIWDTSWTPFKKEGGSEKVAIEDGKMSKLDANIHAISVRETGGEMAAYRAGWQNTGSTDSQYVVLHERGCHAIDLWPRPENSQSSPVLVGSASKDTVGASIISPNGCSLETPAAWRSPPTPHGCDINAVCWTDNGRLWSGDRGGSLKLWDVTGMAKDAIVDTTVGANCVRLEVWPQQGMLIAAAGGGVVFLDTKANRKIFNHQGASTVRAMTILRPGHDMVFIGEGQNLNQYDVRMFLSSSGSKPKPISQWSLRDNVSGLHCTTSSKGHLLVAVGCVDGKVAAFDAT